jgi:hypothetical protein
MLKIHFFRDSFEEVIQPMFNMFVQEIKVVQLIGLIEIDVNIADYKNAFN